MDKISAVEYQKLFSLIEVIYTHAVFTEIERLCEENCCGCKIDHPSQRQHDCLMLTEEEKWELYHKKAVALLNENRSVWDEFIRIEVTDVVVKTAMCLACSHVVRCSETALVFNLAYSVNRVRKFRTVLPMYVAEQPGQENS